MGQVVKDEKEGSLIVSGKTAIQVERNGYIKGEGQPILGKTLPELLYNALELFGNSKMFNRRQGDGWETLSLEEFRVQAEEIALGLLDLDLTKGDRVALYMESDT